MRDRERVTRFLAERGITAVRSSPFRRAVDTVKPFADTAGLPVELVPDFRERRIGGWVAEFDAFSRRQWEDFSYSLPGGESLESVQRRNFAALRRVLKEHPDQTLAVGGHGTALSTLIHFFDRSFGYAEFTEIKDRMPWIVKFSFRGETLEKMEFIHVFTL